MNEKKIRVPKQQRSIEKKNQIKNAALELFSTQGYHNTSSNEIAKYANLSIGTFYSYFSDKSSLYEELLKDFYESTMDQIIPLDLTEVKHPMELIENYIKIIMKCHLYMPEFQMQINSLSCENEHFRKIEDKFRSHVVDKIIELLTKNEQITRLTDFTISANVIHICVESIVHEILFYNTEIDQDKAVHELATMLCHYAFKPEYLK